MSTEYAPGYGPGTHPVTNKRKAKADRTRHQLAQREVEIGEAINKQYKQYDTKTSEEQSRTRQFATGWGSGRI